MASSFYGGSPGLSMIIVKSYLTTEEMKTDFASPNCIVGVGECVCIDSGFNDGKHGNIYRRTTDPTKPEYVGNMSGPMGPGITYAARIADLGSGESADIQIKKALAHQEPNLRSKNILFENAEGTWIYAYSYIDDQWFRVASYDRYKISNKKPTGLSVDGLWLYTQEAPESSKTDMLTQ